MALTRRQRAVLPLLVTGVTVEQAARESRVPAATIWRWLDDPEFQDVLDRALDQQLKDALNRAAGVDLSGALCEAIQAAKSALKARRIADRLAAARLLWDIALRIEGRKLRLPK